MKPDRNSNTLLGITRSKAKMIEFSVPTEYRIAPVRDPENLFPLTIGIIGDFAATTARDGSASAAIEAAKQELRFSAFFFDAFLNGDVPEAQESYIRLLAGSAYYLCGLAGSSAVLVSRRADAFDPDCRGLDLALAWFLKGRFADAVALENGPYSEPVLNATDAMSRFYSAGIPHAAILEPLRSIRTLAYAAGTAREVLLADLILAVAIRRIQNSARVCLPEFTGIDASEWEAVLQKPTFIREFWPAQRLLGEQGVFKGRSAVVQMPTSAGKTKATEILIRSAFLANRSTVAIIVAPFRALCHEIRDNMIVAFRGENIRIDELSDVPQQDFDLAQLTTRSVIILTPEKLLYVLRQSPEIAQTIGVLIYDEGHQFDCGARGITYELLVTSLKTLIPENAQVVLISAVITNAEAISQWLNGDQGLIVAGADLHPTLRSIAFASWKDSLGRLEFLPQRDSGDYRYFVPRVLETFELNRRSSREKQRYFPTRGDGQSIAIYLALKLFKQGAIAIFCGLKGSVVKVCEKLVDAVDRGLPLETPLNDSDRTETRNLAQLIERHFGQASPITKCANVGIFTHHGSTPAGIRLCVEHAMRESLLRVVVCTSTLAQGVNLPIRYLIVTGVYQGAERISVRDFQNLIGRVGRSGMHTEGSIIFADPDTYRPTTYVCRSMAVEPGRRTLRSVKS